MNRKPPTVSGVSRLWKKIVWIFLVAVILAWAALVGLNYWLSIPPKEVVAADAGFKKAKQSIDPEKLRVWALNKISKYKGAGVTIPNSELPDYIQNLYAEPPEDASLMIMSKPGERYIMIIWGGGFFHWGFYVGSTNFAITTAPDPASSYAIAKWVPGIYYGREDTAHKIQ